jgi:hypothetical protein
MRFTMRTDSSLPSPPGAQYVTDAVVTRDAGLRLARRAQRWIAVLAVGTAGGLAALTAHAYHAKAAPASVPRARPVVQPTDDSGATAGSTVPATPIQPPASAPAAVASTQVAPVVSGGS